jgi:branched-chain amino acid transport system substrate-binding protein
MIAKKKSIMVVWVVAFLAVSVIMGASAVLAADDPIKIGVLYTKSGFLAEHGRYSERGVELAQEHINAKGGVLGRKVKAIWRDDQSKAEAAGREANALIFEDKVDFLLGGLLGSTGSAISAVSKENKFPFIVLSQTGSLVRENGHRYIFRGISSSIINARGMATNLIGRGFKKAWTMSYDYSFGHQIMRDTRDYMANVTPDLKVIGESWPPFGEKDYTGYISQMMREKPDVLIANIFGTGMTAFLRQAKSYGFFDKTKVAVDCNPDNIRLGIAYYDISIDNPNNKEFVKAYRAKYNEYPAFASAVFYSGMLSIAKAMEKAGSTEHEAVVDALEKVTVATPYGDVKYRACDHQGTFPVVVGETVLGPGDEWYYIGKNVQTIPAEKLWATCEEVMAARKNKK